jgi:hypothetical protein
MIILVFTAVKFVFVDNFSKNSNAKQAVFVVFKYFSAHREYDSTPMHVV